MNRLVSSRLSPYVFLCIFNVIELDIILSAIIGGLEYQDIKLNQDPEVKRKLLFVSWLYRKGYLNADFPPTARFRPDDPDAPSHSDSDSEDDLEFLASNDYSAYDVFQDLDNSTIPEKLRSLFDETLGDLNNSTTHS